MDSRDKAGIAIAVAAVVAVALMLLFGSTLNECEDGVLVRSGLSHVCVEERTDG